MKKITGILVAAIGMLLPLCVAAQDQRPEDRQRHDQDYDNSQGRWNNRLSAEDQGRFDNYYSRWVESQRRNDGGERASMEERMREVMSRYSIPAEVPFQQIASNQAYDTRRQGDGDGRQMENHGQMQLQEGGYGDDRDRHERRDIPRFSGSDARRFRSYYSRWQQYRQTNNREQAENMERRMTEIMNRHNIPNGVGYDQVMDMLNHRDRR
ncbi:MAG TPA: hypothetical protein VIL63_00895 [Terriglobales bacterium]